MWSILTHLICRSRILKVNFPPGMDFFVKFLKSNENDIIDILVTDTNLYAQQQTAMKSRPLRIFGSHSRFRNWIPVTRDDVLSFLGIVWSMGIINKPMFESNKVLNPVYCRLRCPTLDRNRFLYIHIRIVRIKYYHVHSTKAQVSWTWGPQALTVTWVSNTLHRFLSEGRIFAYYQPHYSNLVVSLTGKTCVACLLLFF